jgi:hypothetical protein
MKIKQIFPVVALAILVFAGVASAQQLIERLPGLAVGPNLATIDFAINEAGVSVVPGGLCLRIVPA